MALTLAGCAPRSVTLPVAASRASTPAMISPPLPPVRQAATPESARADLPAHVALAWDASPDASVTGYAIYSAAGTVTNRQDAGPALTCTVSNLTPAVLVRFWAVAYNAAGVESLPSNVVEYLPPDPGQSRLTLTPEAADDPAGPWAPVPGWPAFTTEAPSGGTRFWRLKIEPAR